MFRGLLGRLSPYIGLDSGAWIGRFRRSLRDRPRWPWHAVGALLNRPGGRLNVQLQTIGACDATCAICPYQGSWQSRHPGRMDDRLFERILVQLEAVRINKFCMYLQNEPLLDPNWLDRLGQVRRRLNFRTLEISTNASRLTAEKSVALLDVLAGAPCEIWISFHGIDEQSYSKNMGLPFAGVLENIVALLKLSVGRGVRISIRSAGRAVSDDVSASPVHFSFPQMETFWKGVFRAHGIEREPALAYFMYHDRAGAVGGGEGVRRRRKSLLGFYCERVDRWLHVLYNGDVILCCNDYNRRTVIGNLAAQDVAELLRSPKFREYRLMAMGLRRSPEQFLCRMCARAGG